MRESKVERRIRAAFDLTNLLAKREDGLMVLCDRIQEWHDFLQHLGGLDHRIGHGSHLRRKIADAIPLDSLGCVLDEIYAVVQHMRERENVFTVNRRVERA